MNTCISPYLFICSSLSSILLYLTYQGERKRESLTICCLCLFSVFFSSPLCLKIIIIMTSKLWFSCYRDDGQALPVTLLHFIFVRGQPEEELDPRRRSMKFIITNLDARGVIRRRCQGAAIDVEQDVRCCSYESHIKGIKSYISE